MKDSERYKDTAEYLEGKQSYCDLHGSDECPYPIGNNKRYNFYMGYYDARLAKFDHYKEFKENLTTKIRMEKKEDSDESMKVYDLGEKGDDDNLQKA